MKKQVKLSDLIAVMEQAAVVCPLVTASERAEALEMVKGMLQQQGRLIDDVTAPAPAPAPTDGIPPADDPEMLAWFDQQVDNLLANV